MPRTLTHLAAVALPLTFVAGLFTGHSFPTPRPATAPPSTDRGFILHTPESAPEPARSILAGLRADLGFVPNFHAALADSPSALLGYSALCEHSAGHSRLSLLEQTVVGLTASRRLGSAYDVAAQEFFCGRLLKLDASVMADARDGRPLADPKLRALAGFTDALIRAHGDVSPEALEAFLAAGYTRSDALEVVLGVGIKTISNYGARLTGAAINEQFAAEPGRGP